MKFTKEDARRQVLNCAKQYRQKLLNKKMIIIYREHGHLEIESCGKLGLCSVGYKKDVAGKIDEITDFCNMILKA